MISADAIRGYVDLIVVSLLQRGPSYAYDLAKTITRTSDGEYTIKQTTLYTALKRLEATGITESYQDVSDTGKPRTYYRLTPAGLDYLDEKLGEWRDTKTLIDRFTEGRN